MDDGGLERMDRRPIAARRLRVFGAMAAALARQGVSPNMISVAGMLAAILAGVCLFFSGSGASLLADGAIDRGSGTERLLLLLAAGLIQLRLLANLLDGMVAVEGGRRTATGELYNEVPDRVSDVAVLIGAGYAVTSSLPALGYLAAIGAVMVAYARALGKGTGHAADFRGPMAKQQRMFIITVMCVFLAAAPLFVRHVLVWRMPLAGMPIQPMSFALLVIAVGCVFTFWRRVRLLADRLRGGSGT